MTQQSTIVFSEFADNPSALAAWANHRNRMITVMGVTADTADGGDLAADAILDPAPLTRSGGAAFVTHVLAANNRELARSFYAYRTFDGARKHILAMRHNVAELQVRMVRGPSAGVQGWVIRLDKVTVLTSTRWYGGTGAAKDGAAAAIAAVGGAAIAGSPRTLGPVPAHGRSLVVSARAS